MIFYIVEGKMIPNSFIVFREINDTDCIEIKVEIFNGQLYASQNLTEEEDNALRRISTQRNEQA